VRPRVLVAEPIAEAGVELLREHFDVDLEPKGDLAEAIADYDGIVVRSATKLTAELIDRADRLKVIGRAGVGVDNVDVAAATRRGIVVANTPDSTVVSAAEQTIGLLVALARNIPQAHAALKEGSWERSRWSGIELAGKTLAVLGFGRIGQQVARRAVGLGMRVVGYDPFVGEDRFRETGVERAAELTDALAAGDFVTLHLPLTDETTGIIGREAIASMRDGARLVNAARGALVDEDALVAAIRSGKLAGAALDVFSAEPYSGPLLELDEVVVTPHLAASTDEAQDRAGVIVAEQVVAALEGGLVTNAVNIPVVDAADLEVLGPFIPLAARLGRLAAELASGWPKKVAVAAHGPLSEYDTRLLTVAALNGLFQGRVDQAVNYVNAPVIAAERGIEVVEERFRASRDYMNLVEVRADDLAVAGTTIGPEPRLFLARAFGFGIDIELAPNLVFLRYTDMPGVIGRVGTMFGEAGVNIANMAVSRTHEAGKALMAFAIDAPAPPELVERVHAEGFDDARFISLGG
jgi:D-3-phosphoglycerate dehydrogenase / 2-oxoglutarate reductase